MPVSSTRSGSRTVADLIAAPRPALSGAVVQISGAAAFTLAVGLMATLLRDAEAPAAIVADRGLLPYSPDLRAAGIELERLLLLTPETASDWLEATDELVQCAHLSVVCAYTARGDTAVSAAFCARAMHRCARSGTTLVIISPRIDVTAATTTLHIEGHYSRATPSQSAGIERDAAIDVQVRRSREQLTDASIPTVAIAGVCASAGVLVADSSSSYTA